MSALYVPDVRGLDTLAAALAYAAAEWYVLPTNPHLDNVRDRKNPGQVVGADWPRRSSRDPAQLAAWFAGTNYGIALHVGRSGAVVFDVDDPPASPELDRLVAELDAIGAPVQRTDVAGRRRHYLVSQPHGFTAGNGSANVGVPRVDVRGANGVIVVEPTPRPGEDGREYGWLRGGVVPAPTAALTARLSRAGERAVRLDGGARQAFLDALRAGPACERVRALEATCRWDKGGRYEEAMRLTKALLHAGQEGHAGVRDALARLDEDYHRQVAGERRDATEWRRQLAGAVDQAAAAGPVRGVDVCDLPPVTSLPNALPPVPTGTADVTDAVGTDAPSLASQLLTVMQLRGRRRPGHLIKGVLRLSSATWLIGAPGSYKSFVGLDWAAHVAAGRAWQGRKVEQRKVVYVLAEGADGFQDRVTAWEARHGAELGEELLILPVAVQARGDNGGVSAQWRELVRLVADHAPGLVVLDTQARLSVGLEENSNTEMGVWIQAVDMLKRAADCCVLVIHHTGRNGADARGASAIDGAQDAEWRVDRDRDRAFTLSCDKMKDGTDDARWSFTMDVVDVGLDEDGEKLTSLVIGQQATRRGTGPATEQIELTAEEGRGLDCYGVVHRVLSELDPHRYGMTLAEVVRAVNAARRTARQRPFTESAVRSALNHGKSRGATGNAGRRWSLTDPAEGLEDGLLGIAGLVTGHRP